MVPTSITHACCAVTFVITVIPTHSALFVSWFRLLVLLHIHAHIIPPEPIRPLFSLTTYPNDFVRVRCILPNKYHPKYYLQSDMHCPYQEGIVAGVGFQTSYGG